MVTEEMPLMYFENTSKIITSENNIYDNGWWLNRINAELVFNYEPLWVSKNEKKKEVEWITAENIMEAAKKYLNVDNYVSVYLKPE